MPDPAGTNPSDVLLQKQSIIGTLYEEITGELFGSTPKATDLTDPQSLIEFLCGLLTNDPVCSSGDDIQNTSNSISVVGTSAILTKKIDMIRVFSPPYWNSKFPVRRKGRVRFRMSTEEIPGRFRDKNVSLIIYPVNDPPIIQHPSNYTVQEDRSNPLSFPSPIRILDDADDVEGGEIAVILKVGP